jgi:hypothetical protein
LGCGYFGQGGLREAKVTHMPRLVFCVAFELKTPLMNVDQLDNPVPSLTRDYVVPSSFLHSSTVMLQTHYQVPNLLQKIIMTCLKADCISIV